MRKILGMGIAAAFLLSASSPAVLAARTIRHHPRWQVGPHRQIGKASIYSSRLQGRHMTDGERFSTSSNAAASKTLPIGTQARVTDLQTGRSADVTIKDRGPVPRGRVVDLTPHTAQQIGLTRKEGIAPVVVVPTRIPARNAETASSAGR